MSILDNKIVVSFEVNNRPVELLVAPNRTVLEVLREDGKAVKSCSILIGQAQGAKITTIEGLEGENGLHPLQKAFIEHFAIQCGYCTPGMILSAKALLDENPHATEDEIREALHGNLCRCTGYKKIIEAIEAARDEINGAV